MGLVEELVVREVALQKRGLEDLIKPQHERKVGLRAKRAARPRPELHFTRASPVARKAPGESPSPVRVKLAER